jgi:hypothetical protein
MDQIVQTLTQYELGFMWRLVVWACIAFLLILGALVFIRPAVVHRFIEGFVTSGRRINFLEVALRLIASLAFVAVSPETKFPVVFFWIGAVLAITAIPMMFLHRFQKSQAVWAIPFAKRILPLMGVLAIAIGVLIAWALT